MIFLLEYHSGLSQVGKAWNLSKKRVSNVEMTSERKGMKNLFITLQMVFVLNMIWIL